MMTHTAEQINEWSNSWTTLPIEEYFAKRPPKLSATGEHGNVPPVNQEVHLKATSQTKIPGRNSFLVDLGSMVSVIGKDTEQEMKATSDKYGYETQYIKRSSRLNINGVGAGSAPCDFEVIAPIAVHFAEQEATKESFRANVATGSGASLPAILGSNSMCEKDSVIVLRKGKEMLVFPGPGGYKIEWSPGTKMLPMKNAPSGHLVVLCDEFEKLPKSKDAKESIAFWTDHSNKE